MKVKKVLNNNVVIAENGEEELVLMGLGLGFGKRFGEIIEENRIEKTFLLKVTSDQRNFSELLSGIPNEIVEFSILTLAQAKTKLDQSIISDTVLIAFADHLNAAIIRQKENIRVKNFLLWDIKHFFPREFEICLGALRNLEEKFGLSLPEDEAGFLAMHIVNGNLGNGHEYTTELTKLMEEILTVLKYTLRVNFSEQEPCFQRFITHLKFFSEQILSQTQNEENSDEDLYLLIKKNYPRAYLGTKKVSEFLEKTKSYSVSQNEQIYLTVHLARILEKIKD